MKNIKIMTISGLATLFLICIFVLIMTNGAVNGIEYTVLTPVVAGGTLVTPADKLTQINGEPIGKTALKPRVASASATTATFSQQDVLDWLKTNQIGGRIGVVSISGIQTIEFLTNHDLKIKYDITDLGVRDTKPICYVVVSGSFTISSPFTDKANTIHELLLIFDSQNGNLLMSGGAKV